jgi:hypothetical protein
MDFDNRITGFNPFFRFERDQLTGCDLFVEFDQLTGFNLFAYLSRWLLEIKLRALTFSLISIRCQGNYGLRPFLHLITWVRGPDERAIVWGMTREGTDGGVFTRARGYGEMERITGFNLFFFQRRGEINLRALTFSLMIFVREGEESREGIEGKNRWNE